MPCSRLTRPSPFPDAYPAQATTAASALATATGCAAYLLPQPPAAPCDDAEGAAPARVLKLTALVAWPGRSRGLGAAAAGVLALGGGARANSTLAVNMQPQILEGLLVGLLLAAITVVGLCCVMTVAVPDVLHSEAMPAGKEY
jgi:hypothetical protein